MLLPVLCLTIVGLLSAVSSASPGDCRFQTIPEKDVSAQQLGQLITKWKELDPTASSADLICCLPKSWRKNYIVLPNSQSAQCSGARFPRVILTNPANRGSKKDPLQRAISFVGEIDADENDHRCRRFMNGDNNHSAIEVMEFDKNNPADRMFQFHEIKAIYDRTHANWKNGVHMNAEICIHCHVTDTGVGPYYPDTAIMASHLGGLARLSSSGLDKLLCLSPEEIKQQKDWSTAFRSIALGDQQHQPKRPYSCLLDVEKMSNADEKNGVADGLASTNEDFGQRLSLSQNYWLAANIRKMPSYSKLKFALVASALGCALDPSIKPSNEQDPKASSNSSFVQFLGANLQADPAREAGIVRHHCTPLDGMCGKEIPTTCSKALSMLDSTMKIARAQLPPAYGEVLERSFNEQGRAAFFNPMGVQKMAQLTYLLSLDKNTEHEFGYTHIAREFFGPNLTNFEDLANRLMDGDPDFPRLSGADRANSKRRRICSQLNVKSTLALANFPSPATKNQSPAKSERKTR